MPDTSLIILQLCTHLRFIGHLRYYLFLLIDEEAGRRNRKQLSEDHN